MSDYRFTKEYWPDYQVGNSREWCLTNGLGSYAGGSLIGGLSRANQGLLVASLRPPGKRFTIIEQMCEWVRCNGHTYDLETSQELKDGKTVYHNGQQYLTDVVYDGTMTFHYECGHCVSTPAVPADSATVVSVLTAGGIPQDGHGHSIHHRNVATLEELEHGHRKKAEDIPEDVEEREMPEFELYKYIALKRDENVLALGYDFVNNADDEADVVLTPWFNFRDHNTVTPDEVPKFYMLRTGDTLSLVPRESPYVRIDMSISSGTYHDSPFRYKVGNQLQTDIADGKPGLTSYFTPYDIDVKVPAHSRCSYSIIISVLQSDVIQGQALLQQASDCFLNNRSAHKILRATRIYYQELLDKAGYNDDIANRLVMSADNFLCKRASTGTTAILAGLPWASDWGRDTMISFTGLTLCTKRYDDAGQILFTYAKYMQHGLIPNMLPDDGSDPLYNTADASLWYFIAVYKYLKYLRADENVDDEYMRSAVNFVYKDIFPVLIDIIDAYENGTYYSIYVEKNGLLHAGDHADQVTWMDVLVGELPVTPRHGCPVELNALWYNALCIMEYLCRVFRMDATHYIELAERLKGTFHKAFWNPDRDCLYDVVVYDSNTDEFTYRDDSIRPNQLYAVSLPFSMLTTKTERSIVETVTKRLFVGTGIRTLSIDNPNYQGKYSKLADNRETAFHQGTAWSFLLGAYFSAYKKVNGSSKEARARLASLYDAIIDHMKNENCIGGICEIFDGDSPFTGGGCYNQAWSVGEILRSYVEDVLTK